MKQNVYFSPSLMCADLLNLKEHIQFFNTVADYLHVDIMDGHFVNNLVFSPVFVENISKITTIPIDCHLMVTNPENYIQPLIKSGASYISFHAETITNNAFRLIKEVKGAGLKVGVVLSPSTPLDVISYYANQIDKLTIMTVDPGYAGQRFIDPMLDKIRKAICLRRIIGAEFLIEADGQVNIKNYKKLYESGNEVFIVGASGLFNLDTDISVAWSIMKKQFEESIN